MRPRLRQAAMVAGALLLTVGLCAAAAKGSTGSGTTKSGKGGARTQSAEGGGSAGISQADFFTGLAVPMNATDLRGPESGFRISGWTSWGGPLKLLELVPDGTAVKAGQLIARFEFQGRDASRWIDERIQRAQADGAQARIQADQTVDGLRVELRRLQLEAKLAALDLQKERAVSRRQADLYRIAQKIAAFEAEAASRRLGAAQRSREAELAFHDQAIARALQDRLRLETVTKRFNLTAPHDGVLRHAYNPRERRKFQKGDAVPPGQKLVAVAKDETLSVRFFVPEHRLAEVREGLRVVVVSPSSGEELEAKVTRIDFFPQELGFLMELPTLPNAREKAFAVTAEFLAQPSGLSSGTELRVKVTGR